MKIKGGRQNNLVSSLKLYDSKAGGGGECAGSGKILLDHQQLAPGKESQDRKVKQIKKKYVC